MAKFVTDNASNCTVIAPDGHKFQEFSCSFPRLTPFYFSFEKYHEADKHYVFNYLPIKEFLDSNYVCPAVAVVAYMLFCYFGQKYMIDRKPFAFRKTMAAWNLFLSVYSMMTVLRGIPALYYLTTSPLKETLCNDPTKIYGGSNDLWTILFVLSKFAELIDTFFIVAHKKPLIVLHWWHHISVLIYTWVAFQERTPSAAFFGPMNACVHSVMYFYYFLMAVNMKPKWFNAIWITVFQLAQMVVGVFVSLTSLYFYQTDSTCFVTSNLLWAAFVIYGSYLYLFAAFFMRRYLTKADKKSEKVL